MAVHEFQTTPEYDAFLRLLRALPRNPPRKLKAAAERVQAALALGYGSAKVCWLLSERAKRGEQVPPEELLAMTKDLGKWAL